MGTYTTNYNLFMPTVGETGWGTLVNGNFITIDTTMKELDTRITAVENEVNGTLSCTSVTASGDITGASFNGVVLKDSGTIIVTPLSTSYSIPRTSHYYQDGTFTVLPMLSNDVLYTGSLTFTSAYQTVEVHYWNGSNVSPTILSAKTSGTSLSFTNIPFLVVTSYSTSGTDCKISAFKLS